MKADGSAYGDEPVPEDAKYYVELTGESALKLKDGSKTEFYAKGLDDGTYLIVETTTPPGYNTADPIEFTITANHDKDSDESMKSEELIITGESVSKKSDNKGAETTVINEQGPVLPETGGIGTTIFYIAGAVLVIGAMILLVTKKRVSGMEK